MLLGKKGKNTEYPSNLRPITLTNCDLKIKTKTFANRMGKVLEEIIHESQTACYLGPILRTKKLFSGKKLNFEEKTIVLKSLLSKNWKNFSKTVQCYHTQKTLFLKKKISFVLIIWREIIFLGKNL